MSAKEYIEKMKLIHNSILKFLDDDDDIEENFQNLKKLIEDQKILQNNDDIKLILNLLSVLSNNHHRNQFFFSKMEKILLIFKSNIMTFQNIEIFNIFKNNKRILLFLLEEKVLIFDSDIINIISNGKYKTMNYPQYFDFDINIYINTLIKDSNDEEILARYPYSYFDKRKKGENDNILEELIRNDSINEFISYVETKECLLNDKIKKSIFESNLFLVKREEIQIIEYAAFCGSFQIFKYLISRQVDLTKDLFLFAVHGNNLELIQFLESNLNSEIDNISYELCFKEAIKCHHNYIADYIQNKFLDQNEMEERLENNYKENVISYSFHYYNFAYFSCDFNNKFVLHYACEYDYFILVVLLLKTKDIDIKMKIVLILWIYNVLN